MINKNYKCKECNYIFSFDEAWSGKFKCKIEQDVPYGGWNRMMISCPSCGKEIIEEYKIDFFEVPK